MESLIQRREMKMRVGKGKENLKMAIEEKKRYDQYLNKLEEWKLNS